MTDTAQLVDDLTATDDAVRGNGWVAPGIGVPGAPLDLLGSTLNPLSGLATAGLSWFTPLVSFLGDGLTQLQGGDAASVTSGSQDFGTAGQDIAGVADTYRQSVGTQTSDWSGTAASDYRDAATQHADGVAGLGQASNTVSSAIMGAGQVVAQAIAEITELIAEAVGQIVPILTQAIARAGETFGESVVEAIPPCVGIAVEYALRIAAKLAALVASGDNLMKLVQGGMGVVDLIQTAMTSISQQSAGTQPSMPTVSDQGAAAPDSLGDPGPAADPMTSSSDGSDLSAVDSGLSSVDSPGDTSLDTATQSAGSTPLAQTASPLPSQAPAAATGAVPIGTAALAAGARVGAGRGADTVRQQGKPPRASGGGDAPGGLPMGAMGARPGEEDKEHHRKYGLTALHDPDYVVAPEVIE